MTHDFRCPGCGYFIAEVNEQGWLRVRHVFVVVDVKEGRIECPQCGKSLYWYAHHHAEKRGVRTR